MKDTPRKTLIKRYANGRKVCNCGLAWYGTHGEKHVSDGSGGWKVVPNDTACEYGCGYNQNRAADEICLRVCEEFGIEADE
jgi:hypothetical protein